MSTEHDVMGPVDFVLLEFQTDKLDGSAGAAILDLVDRGIISILDLLVIQKEADGSFTGIEISDLTSDDLGGIAVFAGARSGLLGDDDLAEAAGALEAGTTGAVIVYENTWARPFVAAAQKGGAQLVASARIPADVVNEVLDALEATD